MNNARLTYDSTILVLKVGIRINVNVMSNMSDVPTAVSSQLYKL